MANGIQLIAAERKRQIAKEGWSAKHDDGHKGGELADAAATYAMTPLTRNYARNATPGCGHETYVSRRDEIWPWDEKWWKPSRRNRVLELVKAGALIAAEIDRLQRQAARSSR